MLDSLFPVGHSRGKGFYRMDARRFLALACFAIAEWAAAQSSPYVGLETREIKALSSDQVEAYLAGDGMGFALAAELNGYPGPKHVVELAAELGLSPDQLSATNAVFQEMHDAAGDIGKRLVEAEASLDGLFADESISLDRLSRSLDDLASLQGRLRFVHLSAHLKMKEILTESQTAHYVALRGYSSEHSLHGQGHHGD